MLTLTQAASLTKKGVIAFIVLTVLGVGGSIGYQVWHRYYLSTLPPVVEKPEMKFGELPKPAFPDSNVSSSNYSYSLDTATGGLPQTPKLLKVYFLPKSGVTLLAPDKSAKLAESLGFSSNPEVVSQTQFKFADDNDGELNVDLTTGNFNFQKQIASGSATLNTLPDQTQIVGSFKNYLSARGLLPDELKTGKSSVTFDNKNPTDSDTAEVTLWPTNVDDMPIVTAAFNRGLVRGTITKVDDENNKFIHISYIYWPVDKSTSSTYPLKTPEQAFADLRAGNGFVSIEPINPKVSISSVYLAYYEQEDYSPYLLPVFVFEGPDFAALVPAIATPK